MSEASGTYYTISYTPANKNFDGKVRKIDVEVSGGKYQLLYRREYIARTGAEQKQTPAHQRLSIFMPHGVPNATQIPFTVKILPAGPPAASSPVKGDNPNIRRPAFRYVLDYSVETDPIHLDTAADGFKYGSAVVLLVAYDGEGKPLNSTASKFEIKVPSADYEKFKDAGLKAHQELDIPEGNVSLKAAVYDPKSGFLGSIEVPLTVKAHPGHGFKVTHLSAPAQLRNHGSKISQGFCLLDRTASTYLGTVSHTHRCSINSAERSSR